MNEQVEPISRKIDVEKGNHNQSVDIQRDYNQFQADQVNIYNGCNPNREEAKKKATKRLKFVIDGTLEQVDSAKLCTIVSLLQQITGDTSIKIDDLEEGSIRLFLDGSEEGLKRLEELFKSGELTEVLGIPVQDVQFVDEEKNREIDAKWCLVEEIKARGAVGRNLRGANLRGSNLRGTDLIYQSHFGSGDNIARDKNISVNKGNYTERMDIKGNYYEQSGNFGIGHVSGGEIQEGAKVAGIINEVEQQNLARAAAEIQQLLEQLSQTYPTNTTTEKMVLVVKTLEEIQNNPTLMQRILSALKAGGVAALEQLLNHPAASFVLSALEDWQQTKDN